MAVGGASPARTRPAIRADSDCPAKGESVPKQQPISPKDITPENVDRFVAMDKPDDY